MASTMLGDSNGTSVGSLYTRVMVDLRDPRYDKTWQRDKDIPKNVFKMKVLRMLMIVMMNHCKKSGCKMMTLIKLDCNPEDAID